MKTCFILFITLTAAVIGASCGLQGVRLSPLTEREIQDLGTIGIAADVSELDAVHTQSVSEFEHQLREMHDRVVDTGKGAYEGAKSGAHFLAPPSTCSKETCLLGIALVIVGVTVGGIAGGIDGALNRTTYSAPPEPIRPDKTTYRAVQQAIDDLGLPEKLRDKLWDRTEEYPQYRFELVRQLPPDPRQTLGQEGSRSEWARYWPLRDKGVRTVLKVRIPFIEFRGSSLDQPYRLFIPVETTLFNTTDRSCIRQRLWEYQGGRHRVDEWNADGAQLFSMELERFFDLVAKRIPPAFFGKEITPSHEEFTTVIPKGESLTCVG